MRLQVCDDTNNRHMGEEELDPNAFIGVLDMAETAERLERGYAFQFDDGTVYELRVWDYDDCIWHQRYTYRDGKLNAIG
ncbi:hypothetical protein ACX6XY_03545 [Streptomyces sp. O3]